MKNKIVNEKWSEQDLLKLIDLVNKYGDNWDEIVKDFEYKKTKEDCITQFLTMPIRENINYKVSDISVSNIKAPQSYILERIVPNTLDARKNSQANITQSHENEIQSAHIKEDNDIQNSSTTIINNNYITVNNHKISNFGTNFKANHDKPDDSNLNGHLTLESSKVVINPKTAINSNSSCINDLSNPLISQLVFFSKMFQKFVEADLKLEENEESKLGEKCKPEQSTIEQIKENIYKTYAKGKTRSSDFQQEEKSKIKMIIDLLIHTQLKKIELKLDYFNEFERLMEFEIGQMKTMESGLVQDRVKFAIKKVELNSQIEKLKFYQNQLKVDSGNASKAKQNNQEGHGSLKEKNLIALTNSGNKYKDHEDTQVKTNNNHEYNHSHVSNTNESMQVEEDLYLPQNNTTNGYADEM